MRGLPHRRRHTISAAFRSVMTPAQVDQALFLLVEDSEDDVVLIQRAFKKGNILNPVQVVRRGEEAIAYLKGEGPFSNRTEYPLPALMLLDLKLPGQDGFQVLDWVRKQPTLKSLRIVVLTSSDSIRDVNLAYQMGANSFLVKPVDFERFVEISLALKGYWLWLSEAPEVTRLPRIPIQLDRPPTQGPDLG